MRTVAVTVRTGPISAQDDPATVPVEKWPLLIGARRSFAQVNIPYDCRELLRFVNEMREFGMVAKLGYADEDDFIRRGLELEPETVREALMMLERMKPEWAVPYKDAAAIGRLLTHKEAGALGGRGHKKASDIITSFKRGTQPEYIRARLKRDGKTELLWKIERGEISANAAAVEAGFRERMIQHPATVDGFARAAHKHLNEAERAALKVRI